MGSWAAEQVRAAAVPALAWELEEAKNPGAVQGDPSDTASRRLLAPNSDTARPCPCPHVLKGKSKSFPGANQHAEKEEQRLLLLHRFQTKSNRLMLASEATRPVTRAGSVGDSSCGEDAALEQPDHPTGTWDTTHARGHRQPQNLGTLKCSGGDGATLVQHPCGHWYHSGDNSHGYRLAGWIIPPVQRCHPVPKAVAGSLTCSCHGSFCVKGAGITRKGISVQNTRLKDQGCTKS